MRNAEWQYKPTATRKAYAAPRAAPPPSTSSEPASAAPPPRSAWYAFLAAADAHAEVLVARDPVAALAALNGDAGAAAAEVVTPRATRRKRGAPTRLRLSMAVELPTRDAALGFAMLWNHHPGRKLSVRAEWGYYLALYFHCPCGGDRELLATPSRKRRA